LSLPLYTAVTF